MRRYHSPVTEIQMRSNASESSRLRKVICRLATATLHDPAAVADVELAVGEAFSNAIKYGCKNGKVCVRIGERSGRELAVEMAYPSSQFDTNVTYPQDVLNANGGFGRYIMHHVLNSMEYSFENDLTTLRITKRRR